MTPELKKLEDLFDMTSHPGWKNLTDDLEERIEAFKEALTRNEATPYQLGLAQGHVKVYREFIGLRNMIEIAIKQSVEDEVDEATNASL